MFDKVFFILSKSANDSTVMESCFEHIPIDMAYPLETFYF